MTNPGGRRALNPAVVRRRYIRARAAIEARRREPTVEAIAEELGRSPRTVRDWRRRFGLADLDGEWPMTIDLDRLARAMDIHVVGKDRWARNSETFRTWMLEEAAGIAAIYDRLGAPTSREAVENEHRRTGVTVQRPTASPDAGSVPGADAGDREPRP